MDERIKQYIILRKDLNMRKGKIAAQAAHASLAVFLNMMKENVVKSPESTNFTLKVTDSFMLDWLENRFTKIGLSVDSEQELLDLYQRAKELNLPCSLIQDAGFTEFSEPTYTAVAIGPADPELIKPLTQLLKLF